MAFDIEAFDREFFGDNSKPSTAVVPPAPKDIPERTWGEAGTDVAAGFGVGVGNLVGGAGSLWGLITGDMANGQALRDIGQRTSDYWKDQQSDELQAHKAQRDAAVKAADGEWEKLGTVLWETIKRPTTLGADFFAEQLPMFVPGMGAGRLAGAAARGLGASTKVAQGVGTGAAVGVGTGQDMGDIAGETYDRLMELDDRLWKSNRDYRAMVEQGADPGEAKQAIAQGLTEAAAASGGLVSLATNVLPGARTIERALTGGKGTGGAVSRFTRGFFGEGLSETAVEGSGQLAGNLATRVIDPNQRATEGLGEAAGMGALSAFIGGPAGLIKNDKGAYSGNDNAPTGGDKDTTRLENAIDRTGGLPPGTPGRIPAMDDAGYEYVGPSPKEGTGLFRNTTTGEIVPARYGLFKSAAVVERDLIAERQAVNFNNEGLPAKETGNAQTSDALPPNSDTAQTMDRRRTLQDLIAAAENAREPATVAALKERVRPFLTDPGVDGRAAAHLFNELAQRESDIGAAAARQSVEMGRLGAQQRQDADAVAADVDRAYAERQAQGESLRAQQEVQARAQQARQFANEQRRISESQEVPANSAMADAFRRAQEAASNKNGVEYVDESPTTIAQQETANAVDAPGVSETPVAGPADAAPEDNLGTAGVRAVNQGADIQAQSAPIAEAQDVRFPIGGKVTFKASAPSRFDVHARINREYTVESVQKNGDITLRNANGGMITVPSREIARYEKRGDIEVVITNPDRQKTPKQPGTKTVPGFEPEDLPAYLKYLQEKKPADARLYNLDYRIEQASEAGESLIGNDDFDFEMVLWDLEQARRSFEEGSGRLLVAINRPRQGGAYTTRGVIDAWVKYNRGARALAKHLEQNPGVLDAYNERQAQLANLKAGDLVYTPYYRFGSESPIYNNIGKLTRKNKKNWSVETRHENKLYPPSVLRVADDISKFSATELPEGVDPGADLPSADTATQPAAAGAQDSETSQAQPGVLQAGQDSDGTTYEIGNRPLTKGRFRASRDGETSNWQSSKDLAKNELLDTLALRKKYAEGEAKQKEREAAAIEKIKRGEKLTKDELGDIGLKPMARFDYLSPVVQRLTGVSKRKVREAMGDALKKVYNDDGREIWYGDANTALANAIEYQAGRQQKTTKQPGETEAEGGLVGESVTDPFTIGFDPDTIEQHPNLSNPEIMTEIRRMAENAGWMEKGGRLLRDAKGNAVGRTTWIPKEEWFAEKPDGVTEKHFNEAVARLDEGRKLTKPQREAVAFMLDYINEKNQDGLDIVTGVEEYGSLEAFDRRLTDLAQQLDELEDGAGEAILEQASKQDLSNGETKQRLEAAIREKSTGGTPGAEAGGREPFGLEEQTEEQARAAADAIRREEQQAVDDAKKAEADAQRGGFTLTGSNRAVDQAEARGQRNLFDDPSPDQDADIPFGEDAQARNDNLRDDEFPFSYATDMAEQSIWLDARARDQGHANLDAMLQEDPAAFIALANQWREANPYGLASSTVADVEQELIGEIGGFRLREAKKSGLIKVVQSAELPMQMRRALGSDIDNAAAFWDGTSMWLIADNIAPGESVGKMLHEAKHAGTDIWGELDDVQDAFDALLDANDPAAIAAQTRASADPSTENNPTLLRDERLAYFVEEAKARLDANHPTGLSERARLLYRQIIAAIKAYVRTSPFMDGMRRKFIDFKLNDEYAVALARQSLRAAERRVGDGGSDVTKDAVRYQFTRGHGPADPTRTEAFKQWFGDWEVAHKRKRIEALVSESVDPERTPPTIAEDYFSGTTGSRGKVATWAVSVLPESANNGDLGTINITRSGIKDALYHGSGHLKLYSLPHLDSLLSNAVHVNEVPHGDGKRHVLASKVEYKGEEFVVELVVSEDRNGRRFYEHEFTEMTKLADLAKSGATLAGRRASGQRASLKSVVASLFSVNPATSSQVVDENGEPLVVYHGSWAGSTEGEAISVFDPDRAGQNGLSGATSAIEFTDDPYVAGHYAGASNQYLPFADEGGEIYPVYLKIKNPFIIDSKMHNGGYGVAHAYAREIAQLRDGSLSADALREYGSDHKSVDADRLANAWDAGEIDGIIIEDANWDAFDSGYNTQYLVFEPTQIKSATGNRGTFDANNPDIRYSQPGGRPPAPPPRDRRDQNVFDRAADGLTDWALETRPGRAIDGAVDAILTKLKLKDTAPPSMKRAMRRYRAKVNKAMGTAEGLVSEGQVLSAEERALLSDVLEKSLAPGVVPPEHVARLGTAIRAALDRQTDELLDLGMITEESASRWRDTYLPRFYQKHLDKKFSKQLAEQFRMMTTRAGIKGNHLKGRGMWEPVPKSEASTWEAMGWEQRGEVPKAKARKAARELDAGASDRDQYEKEGWVYMWRDYTPEERAQMGEIRDAMFRYAAGYLETQKDIALGRLFEQVSQDPELSTDNEAEAGEDWVRLAETKIANTPGVKRYGKLSGMWVHPDVADQLAHLAEGDGELFRTYKRWMAAWKEGKTAMNPAAHMNNVMSNVWAAHFGGVAPWEIGKYARAKKEYFGKGDYYEEAVEHGLLGTEFLQAEIGELFKSYELGADVTTAQTDLLDRIGKLAVKFPGWEPYRETMRKMYTAEDQFFKLMLYIDRRDQGDSVDDAIDHAERYVFNYADLPKGARILRDTALPFVSYTHKAMGMLAYTAKHNPSRLIAPAAFFSGINALSYALLFGAAADDTEEEERKIMPKWMRGSTALGTPKNVRLPFSDQATFLDIYRWIPLGDVFDMENQSGGIGWPAPFMPGNPLLTLTYGIYYNRDSYFGREITKYWQRDADENLTAEGYGEIGRWALQQVLPAAPIIPGSYRFNQLMEGLANAADTEIGPYTGTKRSGDPYSLGEAAMHTVGIKVRSFDTEDEREKRLNNLAWKTRDARREYRKVRKDRAKGAITQQQEQDRLRQIEVRMREIGRRAEAMRN